MLNTRNPCPALDPYNNSNVSEISLLAVANRKSKPETVLKKISTTDNCLGKREREKEREREGGLQIIAVANVIIIAMVNVG